MLKHLMTLLLLAALLAGCASLDEEADGTKGWSADKLYEEARRNLQDANYERAIDLYEKLEARYPFGRHAQHALLESAYAYYKQDEPDTALATLDRFLKTYPRHPNLDYALYLKGLVNFNRGNSFIERLVRLDPSERDPGAARDAFFDFQELVRRFPDSRYAPDAAKRMHYLRNNLARYEVHVADYYMRRQAYVAAANRAQYVIEKFEKTPAIPDALEILIRAYRKLELDDLAQDALRVYELNYPERAKKLAQGRP